MSLCHQLNKTATEQYHFAIATICGWNKLASTVNSASFLLSYFSRISTDVGLKDKIKNREAAAIKLNDLGRSLQQALNILLNTLFHATGNDMSKNDER